MEFIETPTFTGLVTQLLTDDEYREMQNILVEDPERGDIIKGGGGIRKLRYAVRGLARVAGFGLFTTGSRTTTKSTCCWSTPSPRRTT